MLTKEIEHFAYPLPFPSELRELDLVPYRTNNRLEQKINYLFRHVKFQYRELFIEVSTSGSRMLVKDMSRLAVGCTRYFLQHPQQFQHKMENIMLQIFVIMWKQTFKHCKLQEKKLDKYYTTKMKLLSIENGIAEELLRTCDEKDYIQHYDDMVKRRKGLGPREQHRASLKEGTKHFEYLASLE